MSEPGASLEGAVRDALADQTSDLLWLEQVVPIVAAEVRAFLAGRCACPPVSLHKVGCPVVTSPNACSYCGVELDPAGLCWWCDE